MFDVKTTEKNTSILTADPFTMHTIQNSTYLCSVRYTGPEKVVFNERNDYIIPLPPSPYKISDLIVMPKTERCFLFSF